MSVYAVVDSGTTTTRLRLWRDGTIFWSGSRAAGAKDTAVDGNTSKVETALASLLDQCGANPTAIICSGMITSNMGLFELPHLPAPAGLDEIARGIRQQVFDRWSQVPLTFIPGVKTPILGDGVEHLSSGDVLRGEEAEITGLHEELALDQAAVYLHLGSHHKAIDVDASGRILASRTAMTGELLAAITGYTILKSSVVELAGLDVDLDAALAGAKAARNHGMGRALFLVRVGQQLAGESEVRMSSYLLGVLSSLDLPLLATTSPGAPVILYGGGLFRDVLAALIREDGFREVQVVEPEVADLAAARGAVRIYERARELGLVHERN